MRLERERGKEEGKWGGFEVRGLVLCREEFEFLDFLILPSCWFCYFVPSLPASCSKEGDWEWGCEWVNGGGGERGGW